MIGRMRGVEAREYVDTNKNKIIDEEWNISKFHSSVERQKGL